MSSKIKKNLIKKYVRHPSRRHAGQGSGIHVVRNKRGFRIVVWNDERKVVNRVFLDFPSSLDSYCSLRRTVFELNTEC